MDLLIFIIPESDQIPPSFFPWISPFELLQPNIQFKWRHPVLQEGLLNEGKKDVQLYFSSKTQMFLETSSKMSLLSLPLIFSQFLSPVATFSNNIKLP